MRPGGHAEILLVLLIDSCSKWCCVTCPGKQRTDMVYDDTSSLCFAIFLLIKHMERDWTYRLTVFFPVTKKYLVQQPL